MCGGQRWASLKTSKVAEETLAAVYFIPIAAQSCFVQQRIKPCETPVKLNTEGNWVAIQAKEFGKGNTVV